MTDHVRLIDRWSAGRESIPASAKNALVQYNSWAHAHFRRFTLDGLVQSGDPLSLRDVYVPLRFGEKEVDDRADEKHVVGGDGFLDLVAARPRALVVGPPGGGKTTLLRHVVAEIASPKRNEIELAFPQCLAVPLFLRDFRVDDFDGLESLVWHWLEGVENEVKQATNDRFSSAALRSYWDAGRFVVFLDGLDELGNLERRENVMKWVDEFDRRRAESKRRPGVVLLSSRPTGLEGLSIDRRFGIADYDDVPPFGITSRGTVGSKDDLIGPIVYVRPFDKDEIETFVKRWFRRTVDRRATEKDNALRFIEALRDPSRADLRVLARRPSFITLMAFVHQTIGKLPDARAELFERLIEAYVQMLDETRRLEQHQPKNWPRDEKIALLTAIGYASQVGAVKRLAGDGQRHRRRKDDDRLFSWERKRLVALIQSVIRRNPTSYETMRPDDAEDLLAFFIGRTGLIVEPSEGRFQFGHLSFQEYLAAVHIHARASAADSKARYVRDSLWSKLDGDGWQEVATLFMAVDAMKTQNRGHTGLLDEIDATKPGRLRWLAHLLGGREVTFDRNERELRMCCVMTGAVAIGQTGLGEFVRREEENRAAFENTFRRLIEPGFGSDFAPFNDLTDMLEHSRNHESIDDSADEFAEVFSDGSGGSGEDSAPPRYISGPGEFAKTGLPSADTQRASLLLFAAETEWIDGEWDDVLATRVPPRADLGASTYWGSRRSLTRV